MSMNRILVIGGNGSGKSTLSSLLGKKLNLPVVHLDKIFWYGDWQYRTQEEFDGLLQAELEKPQWIIDGNFSRTLPLRLTYCDTVYYLDFSTVRCLLGVTRRVLQNYGKLRPDMGGNCRERFSLEFYRSILSFNRRNRGMTYRLLQESGKDYVVFKNRRQVKNFLKSI